MLRRLMWVQGHITKITAQSIRQEPFKPGLIYRMNRRHVYPNDTNESTRFTENSRIERHVCVTGLGCDANSIQHRVIRFNKDLPQLAVIASLRRINKIIKSPRHQVDHSMTQLNSTRFYTSSLWRVYAPFLHYSSKMTVPFWRRAVRCETAWALDLRSSASALEGGKREKMTSEGSLCCGTHTHTHSSARARTHTRTVMWRES